MRAAPGTARAAALVLVLLLAASLLAACSAREGNGGVPTQTIQPPGGTEEPSPTQSPTATGEPSPTESPTEEPSPGIDAAGIYADNCQSCHGANGEGGVGPDLRPLTDDDLEMMITTIANGRGGMPAFEGQLSEEEIRAVAQHEVQFEQ